MQYTTLLTLALAAFAVADKTVTETPTAEAKTTDSFTVKNIAQSNDLSAYTASLTGSAYSKYTSALASASTSFDLYNTQAQAILQEAATRTDTSKFTKFPDVPTGLPKDVKSFVSSVYKQEISIITRDVSATGSTGAAATAAPMNPGMKVAGVVGAGLLGAAAML